MSGQRGADLRVGVVIPTWNEAETIGPTLDALRAEQAPDAVVVSDSGSQDGTVAIARARGVTVVAGPAGRGTQLEAGRRALGWCEVCLFLHADTRLGFGALRRVREVLARRPRVVAGAFRLGIDSPDAIYRWIERGANLRSAMLGLPYGDQAIFARREALAAIGGVPALPLMEDVELIHRLGRLGRVVLLDPPVRTSARRWKKRGAWRQTARNLATLAAWRLGADPVWLYRHYHAPLQGIRQTERGRTEAPDLHSATKSR